MDEVFRRAARSALWEWSQNLDGLDDLVQSIWVWYLSYPKAQKKFAKSDDFLIQDLVRTVSLKILKGESIEKDIFDGKWVYSADAVREALRGESTNEYMQAVLPAALEELKEKAEGRYYAAIKRRYSDNEQTGSDKKFENALRNGTKVLTELVNNTVITADLPPKNPAPEDKEKVRQVSAKARRASGGHADPTANMAIKLIEHPEMREHYYEEEPLQQFLGGRGYVQPV